MSYVMLGFLMLAGAATLRLHKTTALGQLANNQVLLFSMICTLFSGVLIVFWFYLFWLFVSIGYGLALVRVSVAFERVTEIDSLSVNGVGIIACRYCWNTLNAGSFFHRLLSLGINILKSDRSGRSRSLFLTVGEW